MSHAAPGTASGGPVRPEGGTSPLVREQLTGALAECSDDLLASADLDGRVLTWPRTGERLYGYSAEEMIGRPVEAFLGGGPAAQAVRRAAAGEEIGPDRARHRRRDGSAFDALVTLRPMRAEGPDVTAVAVIVRDITRDVHATHELEEAAASYRLLAAYATDALVRVDPVGVFRAVSAAGRELYGYEESDLIGRSFLELVHPDDLATVHASMEEISSAGGAPRRYEARFLHADGRWIWSEVTARAVLDDNGEVTELLGCVRDVSVRKAAEEQLRASNAELARYAHAASHDLQEPLRVIAASTEMLARAYGDALDADGRELLGHAQRSTDHMQELIDDLLRLATVGSSPLIAEPVALAEVVDAALHNLAVTTAETGATVDVGELPTVRGDRGLLVQVFQNLVANAIKFTPPDRAPRIRIESEPDGPEWRIAVTDNGIGIDAAQIERIFGMFARLHAQDQYPGTGIGLALCARIIERHRGRIWAQSLPGEGSVFSFTLPAAGP